MSVICFLQNVQKLIYRLKKYKKIFKKKKNYSVLRELYLNWLQGILTITKGMLVAGRQEISKVPWDFTYH